MDYSKIQPKRGLSSKVYGSGNDGDTGPTIDMKGFRTDR